MCCGNWIAAYNMMKRIESILRKAVKVKMAYLREQLMSKRGVRSKFACIIILCSHPMDFGKKTNCEPIWIRFYFTYNLKNWTDTCSLYISKVHLRLRESKAFCCHCLICTRLLSLRAKVDVKPLIERKFKPFVRRSGQFFSKLLCLPTCICMLVQ